jgi:hypothetical protein
VKLVARARYRVRRGTRAVTRRRSEPPILVYQMGKVGSTTVCRSLRAMHLRRDVHQVHLLNLLDEVEASVRRTMPDPRGTLREIERARALRALVLRARDVQFPVISLVRDPVQRNVSAFFQNVAEVVPDVYVRHRAGRVSIDELRTAFLERYDHGPPLTWFPTQMEPVFGIDVFATPFDPAAAWATYESPTARLLVVRLEDLPTQGAAAVRAFLDLDRFELVPANVGGTKAYADLYASFREQVRLPADYLDRMYESPLALHFYTGDERARFRRRWERGPT